MLIPLISPTCSLSAFGLGRDLAADFGWDFRERKRFFGIAAEGSVYGILDQGGNSENSKSTPKAAAKR